MSAARVLQAKMLETLRDLLFKIPAFQTLAEPGIPAELIPTHLGRQWTSPDGRNGRPQQGFHPCLPIWMVVPTSVQVSRNVAQAVI